MPPSPKESSSAANSNVIATVVSRNLRRLREERQISISELARRSGIAKATLSKLETGTGNPTVVTLVALSEAFGVLLGDLLIDQSPRVLRASEGPFIKGRGTIGRLVTRLNGAAADIYEVLFRQGKTYLSMQAIAAVEKIYVISGTIVVEVNDERIELAAGDLIQYPLAEGAKITASGGDAKTLLIMAYTQHGHQLTSPFMHPGKTG